MKVYLINPPAAIKMSREGRCMVRGSAWAMILPPFSLVSCAAVLRKNGFEVKVTDCIAEGINLSALEGEIKKYNPDLVILNTTTPSIDEDLKVVEIAKKISLKIKTGIIGIHPSSLPNKTFSLSKGLDYIIRGEPEISTKDLALVLDNNQPLSKVKGISYRIAGEIFHNPPREFIKDLDSLPFPAWDLIDVNNYKIPFTNNPFLLILPSRGCPYQCIFCNAKVYYGEKSRLRSPQKIVKEMKLIKDKFKVEDFLFWTESFTLRKRFVMEIADEILRRGLKFRWICSSRVDNVDLELLEKMKKAGCWMIGFGIESGDQKILNDSKKGITLEQSINAVRLAKKVGMEISIHCIIGLPGETKKTALKTLSFAKSLDADYAQFYCAVPFPGSELYKMAGEKKWLSTSDWSRFNQSQSVLNTETLKAEEVMQLRKKAYFNYYLRPKQIFGTLRKIRSVSELRSLFYLVKDFLGWIR